LIPLHDMEARRRPPVATRLLIAANVLLWIYVLSLARDTAALGAFYDRWSFDPAEMRAAIASGQLALAAFAPLVSHQFVHAGWLHLIGNMLYLWIFGDLVEDRFGSGPFLIFYLVAGVAAAIGQALVAPAPMVGASGAIAGVLGAYVTLSPTARVRTLVFLGIFITIVTLPAIVVIGEWLIIQVLSGLETMRIASHRATESVAYVAHVVGFIVGVGAVLVLRLGR
jgi:membrane associated rhomboid family serine protease